MKSEYLHPKKTTGSPSPNPTAMFSNLHHHHHARPFSHQFHLDDDPSSTPTSSPSPVPSSKATRPKPTPADHPNAACDGASIEVVRRPRGRPPGSKNKPKPPLVITRDPEPTMSPYILEVPSGTDVVRSISSFCRRKAIGLCVLAGSGAVANFTLRHPSSSPPGATVTFHGRFDILSISATFVPQAAASTFFVPDGFKISVAGPQGQMLGGSVAGPLVAAGPVFVMAATFSNPMFHRLPAEDEEGAGGGGGSSSLSGRGADGHSPPASGGGESAPPPQQPAAADSGVSMYSCHLPSDVIWARAPRQAPPY